jgi:hypothetical protein
MGEAYDAALASQPNAVPEAIVSLEEFRPTASLSPAVGWAFVPRCLSSSEFGFPHVLMAWLGQCRQYWLQAMNVQRPGPV